MGSSLTCEFDSKGYIKYEDSDYESEVWKEIEIVPEYEISNLGRVRNRSTQYILRPIGDKDGYLRLLLRNKGSKGTNTVIIHQFVAEYFLGEKDNEELVVNHINEIKQDNKNENLEWVTVQENTNHGTRNKKVSKALSEPIILVSKAGDRFYFDSCTSLERVTNGKFTRKGSSSAKNRGGVHRGYKVVENDGDEYDYNCSEDEANLDLDENIECLLSMMDVKAMRPDGKFHTKEDMRKSVVKVDNVTGEKTKYSSIAEAMKDGYERSNIIAVIKGRRRSHKNCKWYYAD